MMKVFVASALLSCCSVLCAAQASEVQLKIEPTNRTLSISADDHVSVEPEIAVLHIGFETGLDNAKDAYAAGTKTSNQIVSALKQAGVEEKAIRSEWQRLERDYSNKQHKFKLVQQWTVKVPPMKVAEVLDTAVNAGANDSGQIEWTVNDPKALEIQALSAAAARARQQAEELAKAMGVKLGPLVYVTNQMSGEVRPMPFARAMKMSAGVAAPPPPLAIEPNKVERTAQVFAVYAIE
jgi:hypothetical protein